jgi:hypothetical protein
VPTILTTILAITIGVSSLYPLSYGAPVFIIHAKGVLFFCSVKGAAVVSSFMHFFYSSLSLSLHPVTPDISDATAPADAIPIFCHLQL